MRVDFILYYIYFNKIVFNLNVIDDIFHFLFECPHFNNLRNILIIQVLSLPQTK